MNDIMNNVYCELCNSLLIAGKCTNRNCFNSEIKDSKRSIWKFGSEIVRFNKQVSFVEAKEKYKSTMKDAAKLIKSKRKNNKY